ncbi:MAG: hypothetical protein NTV16_01520 [Actinobacteria bacterium]|nr:hypothetical protein [Actinomycetota bacterium]
MKYLTKFYEVPLINMLRPEDLNRLNARFRMHHKPQRIETARIIEQVRLDEIDRLMRTKPVGGGYGISRHSKSNP